MFSFLHSFYRSEQIRPPESLHTYENTGNLSTTGSSRLSGRLYGAGNSVNHRRTSSNVSNSSIGGIIGLANSSNINPSFRLEDELDSLHVQPAPTSRVVFDLDPRTSANPPATSYRIARQNSLEMERPGTLVLFLKLDFKNYRFILESSIGSRTSATEIQFEKDQLFCCQQCGWKWRWEQQSSVEFQW